VFLKFEFQDDRSINVGAVGVKIFLFPLTRLIAYTTACCYRTSHDGGKYSIWRVPRAHVVSSCECLCGEYLNQALKTI